MKKLFLSLSLFCFLGASKLAYGSWHMTDIDDPSLQPKGDCLEMLCPHGCLEDDKGNAHCCSAGDFGGKCWGGFCCKEGLICSSATDEGTCVECVKDSDCEGGLVCNSDNTCGGCPTGTPKWDGSKCVECMTDEDCEGKQVCNSDNTCGCPKEHPVWNGSACVACTDNSQCEGTCPVCMNGMCYNSEEVIVPQFGIFAQSTQCYAIKEIAHLGPYNCNYDIYVKGHIDDTFLVKNAKTGTNVCDPNNKQHHMADGVLYTIPAGQEVRVYAKDTACAIIAWERDYHGAEARTPVAPTMKIIRSSRKAGYCNSTI